MFHQRSVILLLILLHFYLHDISCEFSLDRITKCFNLNQNHLKYKDKKVISNKVFFLYYADNGIEAFNVIDSYDIQRLKLLVQCIETEDKSYFEDRSAEKYQYHHGGSNVTYLTGIFQRLIPDLDLKIKDMMKDAFKKAMWDKNKLNQLGLRTVQYLSFEKAGLTAYNERKKVELIEKQRADQYFVIYPDIESENKARLLKEQNIQSEIDPESDEAMSTYVHGNSGTVYTIYLSLSDRYNFAGGEILSRRNNHILMNKTIKNKIKITKNKRDDDVDNDIPREDEDLFDDADDDISIEEQELFNSNENIDNIKHSNSNQHVTKKYKKFDPVTTEIVRFTPEKYSALILNANTGYGMKPILYGARKILMIEYWSFMDADIGTTYPSIQDAKPWILNNEEL